MTDKYFWPMNFAELFGFGEGEPAPLTQKDIASYEFQPGVRERYKTTAAWHRALIYMPDSRPAGYQLDVRDFGAEQ